MLPTLNLTGDVILAEHVSHRFGKIGLGDVALVRSPTDPMKMVTKRVLGLEGHRLSFYADPLVGDDSVNVVVAISTFKVSSFFFFFFFFGKILKFSFFVKKCEKF